MLRISEVLANPAGTDSGAEFVELEAQGSSEALALYRLENGAGRGMSLPSVLLKPGERVSVKPTFMLRNQNEALLLRRNGIMTDRAEFPGEAPSGKSLNRSGDFFLLGDPTPGLPNQLSSLTVIRNSYPPGDLFPESAAPMISLALTAGILFAACGMLLFIYARPYIYDEIS
jgi:hypothetical protein